MQIVSRLIDQFVPENYNLSLVINRTARTFLGIVTINGTTQLGFTAIGVHVKDLKIESVTFDGKAAKFALQDNDELIISHPDILEGKHTVVIAYHGVITDAMHGIYPCLYEHAGLKKELIATQFESHHAREVFPCIDEPAAKATFDLTLTTETGVTVLGNMPIKNQANENGKLVTMFQTTPRMSPYLLAWVIGELHSVTAHTKRGVEVNIWATPAQPASSLAFALDIAARTIDFFDDYFQTPYPLPKSDHVALPDFSSGAMENWGLITYREIALLADPSTTSISSRHYIATVIAHELSHQWFGNLVTMKWWNDLWLNESFATIMEYIAIDALQPDWNIWLDFATGESIMALRRDSLAGVQAVQVAVNHPDEINTLFDSAIVYAKGARLLRMLQNYLGHEAFQAGLKTYFAKFSYQNTESNDLWQALEQASGKNIARFMSTWISQSGYPVISVETNEDSLQLSQTQFFTGPHEPSLQIWPLPLNASLPWLPEMFSSRQTNLPIQEAAEGLRLNVGDTAHFVTHYSPDLLQKLITEIENQPVLNRLQLLHEQTLLARGGIISSAALIPLLHAYKAESEEAVWDIMSLALGDLKKFVLRNEPCEQKLRQFAAQLARSQYERLGWFAKPLEPETDTKLRATIIGTLLYGEDPEVISQALKSFSSTPLINIDPELRSLIISAVVRHSNHPGLVDNLISQYTITFSAELQQDIATGLTSTRSRIEIAKLLDCLTDDSIVRHQDVVRWFVGLIRNRDGRATTWEWLRSNWPWLTKSFSGDKSYDDFPRYAAGALMTRQELLEYKAFFGPMQTEPSLRRVINVGINEIEGRVDLIERDEPAVLKQLNEL